MSEIYKLRNQIKHYEWGSPIMIPDFLGLDNHQRLPYAEMWMGTHAGAPSFYDEKPLKEIAGDLPFLFKLLAVDKPLSIQAHPDKKKAEEGFELEELAKIDIKSPMRNYKDSNHKPELICALSRFSFMAGFRNTDEIFYLLEDFLKLLPQLKEIISPLKKSLKTDSLAVFFRILFDFTVLEKQYISELIRNTDANAEFDLIKPDEWNLIKDFANQYPEDPAILSPLYLNYITIEPKEAVYIPPGVLHSYVSGFGIELMASSDNVLRGGLTPKYIDIPELMNIVNFKPSNLDILKPDTSSWVCYENEDFSLAIMHGDGTEKKLPIAKPSICLITEGELVIDNIAFKKGESFFVKKDQEACMIKGVYTAFFAFKN